MIIKEDRTRLDQALGNPRLTVLLLSGVEESKAGKVYDFVSNKNWEPFRRFFLITDLTVLSEAEQTRWFDGTNTDYYAAVGGKERPKSVAQKGPIEDLLRTSLEPDILEIRGAFAAGDQM